MNRIRSARFVFIGFCLMMSYITHEGRGAESTNAEWQVVDVGAGTKPSFDFDAAGRIHVMGMTETGAGVVWHALSDKIGNPWTNTTVANGYFYGPGDLRVDTQGAAHLSWHNHNQADADHAIVSASGVVTRTRINTPVSHDGWDNSLAIGPSGAVHMAAVDPSNFGATQSLEYGVLGGTSWTYTVGISGSEAFMYGLNTSCAVDSWGAPHIAYCKAADWTSGGELRYASMTGGTWNISTIVASEGRGRFPSMALDTQDCAHVAWLDIDPATNTTAYVLYAKYTNMQWHVETIDALHNVTMGFSGARKSVSLALDSHGRVHLAYGDKRLVRYARKFRGRWYRMTVLEDTADKYNGLVVLRLDPWDKAGIVFWQAELLSFGMVRFAQPYVGWFFMTSIAQEPGPQVKLNWESGGGDVSYRVSRTSQLSPSEWYLVHGTGYLQETCWIDTNTSAETSYYYRVEAMQELSN